MIDSVFLQSLQERLRIEDIVAPYVELKRSGKNYKGLCPFHGERSPSFTVFTDTNSFYCFGCQAGGGIVSFVQKSENLSFIEAVKYLCEKNNIPLPDESGNFDNSLFELKRKIHAANREAARFYNQCLFDPKNAFALDYFVKRGLSISTIKHFGLGYAPNNWDSLKTHLKSKGFSEKELIEANLIRRSEKGNTFDNFRNRVMFPIIDVKGNVVAFGGRVMDDSKPKYVNTSDTPVYTKGDGAFAINFAKRNAERKLILVEGYMDVIALHQAGFTNAVACLGTAFTDKQTELLGTYADEILICYDNDEAGKKATERALSVLGRYNEKNPGSKIKLMVITMEGGKDADEIIRTKGAEAFQKLISSAGNQLEYQLEKLKSQCNISLNDGKIRYLTGACEILASQSATAVDIYATKLANELNVSIEAIKAQVNNQRQRLKGKEKYEKQKVFQKIVTETSQSVVNPEKKANLKATVAEEKLLCALLKNPDYFIKIKDRLSPDDFVTQFNKKAAVALFECLEAGAIPSFDVFAPYFTGEEINAITTTYIKEGEIPISLKACIEFADIIKKSTIKEDDDDVGHLCDEEWAELMRRKK